MGVDQHNEVECKSLGVQDDPVSKVLNDGALSHEQVTPTSNLQQRADGAPFAVQLLTSETQHASIQTPLQHANWLRPLLPAAYRRESGDLATASNHVTACIDKELDLHRLTNIHDWLWIAGPPLPPRALHHQVLVGRQILITERMDMHLVGTTGRLFLKPVPRFLLDPDFWVEYLCCPQPDKCDCSNDQVDTTTSPGTTNPTHACDRESLRRRALGFLFSYAALISHESDFHIAKQKHLLPAEVQWPSWAAFIEQLDMEHIYPRIDRRFHHGELQLSRLNKIYILHKRKLGGYVALWNKYGVFFRDNFAVLSSAIVYIAIVLTAMQVGLSTTSLAGSERFQAAARGFTIFAILGPLLAGLVIFLMFLGIFLYNWVKSVQISRRQLGT